MTSQDRIFLLELLYSTDISIICMNKKIPLKINSTLEVKKNRIVRSAKKTAFTKSSSLDWFSAN